MPEILQLGYSRNPQQRSRSTVFSVAGGDGGDGLTHL
jgi:hypothetical protein